MTQSEWHGTRAERLDLLVSKSQSGDLSARRQMEAFIYRELRRLASTYIHRERHADVWTIAGLVNETITRIAGAKLEFEDQHHFYATAARIMRSVLVEYAKTRRAARLGGKTIDSILRFKDTDFGGDGNIGVVEVDHVLDCLAVQSPDSAHAVELHYFAGLTLTETAKLMNTSVAAVTRQIRFAKAWLSTHIEERAKN